MGKNRYEKYDEKYMEIDDGKYITVINSKKSAHKEYIC